VATLTLNVQITCKIYHVKRFLIDLQFKTKASATEFRPLFVKVLQKALEVHQKETRYLIICDNYLSMKHSANFFVFNRCY
jgi:hypothetical protein